jgi:VanZ family protein
LNAKPTRQASLASVLALAWIALIVYASLYPFSGWRWPPGADFADLARLPWPGRAQAFDAAANLVGYLPLGLLLHRVAARRQFHSVTAFAFALAVASLLSFAMEVTQHLLPPRVPSMLDWVINSLGAAAGAGFGAAAQRFGLLAVWRGVRDRWLEQSGGGLVLLLLTWPLALLPPAAAPFALGQVYPPLHETLLELLDGVPWADSFSDLLLMASPSTQALSTLATALIATLGLVAPVLLAYSIMQPSWRRLRLAGGLIGLGLVATTLSTALHFGPEHAFAWWTSEVGAALIAATLLLLALAPLSAPTIAALALVALTAELMLVAQAPTDAYFAQSLQSWTQGRFIHFNGIAQWIAWAWPFAALVWLLRRLGRAA